MNEGMRFRGFFLAHKILIATIFSVVTTNLYATTKTSPNAISNPPSVSTSSNSSNSKGNNIDPLENFNRNSFRMNTTLDTNLIRPVTVWYITYIPLPIRSAIANFYNNLRDCVTLGNDILQLEGRSSMETTMRIGLNSTIGLAGILDVASAMGLKMHKNTFGKTLQTYGWKNSSYFMIPLLGPSTIRDAIGMIPDVVFNPTWYLIDGYYYSVGLFILAGIDTRSKFLDTDQLIYSALDPYTTMRDFYLQNRGQEANANQSNEVSINSLLNENDDNDKKSTKSSKSPKDKNKHTTDKPNQANNDFAIENAL